MQRTASIIAGMSVSGWLFTSLLVCSLSAKMHYFHTHKKLQTNFLLDWTALIAEWNTFCPSDIAPVSRSLLLNSPYYSLDTLSPYLEVMHPFKSCC